MRKLIQLPAVAALIALLSVWHGATASPVSRAALYFLPLLMALGIAVRASTGTRRLRR